MISALKYLPLTKALTIYKGSSFEKVIPLTGVISFDGEVAGHAAMKLYIADVVPDLTFSVAMSSDSNGNFNVSLSATPEQTKSLEAGHYFFDLSITDGTDTLLLCTGMVHVKDSVSTGLTTNA